MKSNKNTSEELRDQPIASTARPVRIVVVDSPEGAGRDLSVEIEHFPDGHELSRFTYTDDPAALIEACANADAILTDYAPLSRELLHKLPHCRLVSVAATGWDCVDVQAARERGISVCCVGEYCSGEVADHTMALMLALNRKLMSYHAQVQRGKSWAYDEVTGIRRLAGQTLGIIGLGRIGREVARRATGFGLNIIAHDPFLNPEDCPEGIELTDFDGLLGRSDIITLHCNLAEDSRAMLDAGAFAKMDRRPLLINVARGMLIDEPALLEALDSGRISAAALDVLAQEPPAIDGHPLAGRDNVILTPHVAFYSDQSLLENREISALNIRHFFAGRFDQVFRFIHHAQ
jgi:D-3-phosphoglycerate dehydrogenase